MADWSVIRSALEGWVEERTGLPAYWAKRPRGWPSQDGGYAILSISARQTVGNDMINSTYNSGADAGEEIEVAQEGSRTFVFGVQIRTFRQSDDVDALHYTSILRDSTSLPTLSTALFEAAGIDFASIVGEADIDSRLDGREVSVAQLDMLFNTTASVSDTATGYINTINDLEFFDVDNPSPPLWTGDIEVS